MTWHSVAMSCHWNLGIWIAWMWHFFWLHMWTCDIPSWKFNLGFIMQFEPAPRRGEPDVTRRTPDYFLWVICCIILIFVQDCNSGCWSVTFLLEPYDKVTWPAIARKCCGLSVRINLHSWLQEVLSTYHPNRRRSGGELAPALALLTAGSTEIELLFSISCLGSSFSFVLRWCAYNLGD
jgi:hypothetical protein